MIGPLRMTVLALVAAALAACAVREEARVATLAAEKPKPSRFSICHGNTCRLRSPVSLKPEEWQQVRDLFASPAEDAAAERRQIALAIGRLETIVGAKTGTSADAPGMGVHWNTGAQLDCVDEAVNTTQYLRMLHADGLLFWHRPGQPAHRGRFGSLWPSNTATVVEKASGRRYAIDSYFLANGEPASVAPLPDWLEGWEPENGPAPESY